MTFEISELEMLTIQKVGKMIGSLVGFITYAKELTSIYICYSTGDWFNTSLSGFITSTCGQ